jgi:kumamolisin
MPFSKYVKVPGSERQPLPGATKTGSIDPNEVMQVTLILRSRPAGRKQAPLDKLVASGKRITREQLAAEYGADPGDVEKVSEFAAANQLSVAEVNEAARSVVLTGKTGNFAKAFKVKFDSYQHAGRSFRGRSGAVSIPIELDKIVQSVHGLDNRPQAQAHFRVAPDPPSDPAATAVSYTARQVAQAYSFPTGPNGSGETIGIIELGGGFTQSDLNTYFSGLGISPAPTVAAVSVDGAQNQPTGDTSGPDTEVMLDIEVAGAVAPAASIVVYFAPNTDAGFLDAINQAVTDTTNKPSVISISWGGPESSWTAQSLESYNSALQSAAAVGVTVCVAAGDNGSSDGVNDGADHVDFPSSSPYALACGGTTLMISGGTISSEVVWNELASNEGATGGGVSTTFALPTWQANINVPAAGSFRGRGLPDVAGDADPTTGYQVQVDGSSFAVGGTSAVAPLWGGLIALFNQSLGRVAGYLNPNLYQSYAAQPGTFRDIASGNNGDFNAGPGWDACTGWGSPNGVGLLTALSAGTTNMLTSRPTPAPTPTPTPTLTPTPTTTSSPARTVRPTQTPRLTGGPTPSRKRKPAPTKKQKSTATKKRRPVSAKKRKAAPIKQGKDALKRPRKTAMKRSHKSSAKRGRRR